MTFKAHEIQGVAIAEVDTDGVCVQSRQDALDLLARLFEQGFRHVVMREAHFDPAFFNLRSGLAGEVLQKFVTYEVKLAIVGAFDQYESQALRDFIYESNRGTQLFFTASREEALQRLAAAR